MINVKQIAAEAGQPWLRIIGILQLISLLAIITSIFVWLWADWHLAMKIALSGVVGILFMKLLYVSLFNVLKECVLRAISKQKSTDYFSKKAREILKESVETPVKRISLNADNFASLVSGEIVIDGDVQISLEDIGFREMKIILSDAASKINGS